MAKQKYATWVCRGAGRLNQRVVLGFVYWGFMPEKRQRSYGGGSGPTLNAGLHGAVRLEYTCGIPPQYLVCTLQAEVAMRTT